MTLTSTDKANMTRGLNHSALNEVNALLKGSMCVGEIRQLTKEEIQEYNAAVDAMKAHAEVVARITKAGQERFAKR